MFVGVLRVVLQIPGARTLKDRRQVVKSAKERLRAREPVSVAEVGDVERIQTATLGIAVVAREAARCEATLEDCRRMLSVLKDALLTDTRSEIVPFGAGGEGLARGLSERLEAELGSGVPRGETEGRDDTQELIDAFVAAEPPARLRTGAPWRRR